MPEAWLEEDIDNHLDAEEDEYDEYETFYHEKMKYSHR